MVYRRLPAFRPLNVLRSRYSFLTFHSPSLLYLQGPGSISATRQQGLTGSARKTASSGSFLPAIGFATSVSRCHDISLSAIRNISVWGHIDAGKTTLTERLLYHSGGHTSSPEKSKAAAGAALPGDVDSGSTVTDFLQQERERGITIQSAAVGPLWWTTGGNNNAVSEESSKSVAAITLVDTPGHIDFTIEVERALRVADGCIVVIDSVEGVEAQTEGNWRIGHRYGIKSNILFLNKLDRAGASLANSLRSFVQRGLHPRPVLLQLPILRSDSSSAEIDGGIHGIVDLLEQRELHFSGRAGEEVRRSPISNEKLKQQAIEARFCLIETLASLDEPLLEELLSIDPSQSGGEPHAQLSARSLRASLRRLTTSEKVVPALIGSAAKHIGVQPLLDAVVDYLPSPAEAGDVRDDEGRGIGTVYGTVDGIPEGRKKRGSKQEQRRTAGSSHAAINKSATAAAAAERPALGQGSELEPAETVSAVAINVQDPGLTALAFKVVWDKRRGPMTFVRVYSGILKRTTTLLNTATKSRERLNRLLLPFGSTYTEVERLIGGQVGVLLGLRDTRTGDTLVDVKSEIDPTLQLRRVDVPPPVFSVSVEPHSKTDEEAVNEALANLVRTDPSLRVHSGNSIALNAGGGNSAFGAAGTNQTVLSGMGELHLEIAKDRLKNEFGARARIGSVRVSFRETLDSADDIHVEEVLERDMAGKRVKFGCKVCLRALREGEAGDKSVGDNLIEISLGGEEDLVGTHACKGEAKAASRDQEARRGSSPSNRSVTAVAENHRRSQSGEGDRASSTVSNEVSDAAALHRSITAGVTTSLSRGPLSSHPLTRLSVRISDVQTFGPEVSPLNAVSALTQALVRKTVREAGVRMMEPVMDVQIQTEESFLGKVVSDVTTEQKGDVVEVAHEGAAVEGGLDATMGSGKTFPIGVYVPPESWDTLPGSSGDGVEGQPGPAPRQKTTIVALIPLSKLVSYSSRLRALTAGTGTYTMRLHGFKAVSDERQRQILGDLGRV